MIKLIAIVAGEPNSINSEIIAKAWKKASNFSKKKIFIIGNFSLLNNQFKKLKLNMPTVEIKSLHEVMSTKKLNVFNVPLDYKNPFKIKDKSNAKYILKSINIAHEIAYKKKIAGFINCSVNKKIVFKSQNIGVTEYLAKKNNLKQTEIMMIYNKKLSVVPITTHINLKKVAGAITKDLIVKKVLALKKGYKALLKTEPKIAILGLNPHNNELRSSSEEIKKIIPAIKKLKKLKCKVLGPLPADMAFTNNIRKKYNVIIGMYHDQVLVPFKALYGFNAINITLGLKYPRLSPDHGTGKDLVGKNKADFSSLIMAIKFFEK